MILDIKHKGLRLLWEDDDVSKVQPNHLTKLRNILTLLEVAQTVEDMRFQGSDLHKLTGELKDFWAVKVDKNYRIIFKFEDGNSSGIDYLDYH